AVLAASSLEVPFVAQRKDTCGAAALAMVLRYWGDDATHDDVARTLLTPELHGIAGSRLAEFARGRGMEAVAYKGDVANLRAIAAAPSRREARVELAGLRFLEKRYEDAAAGFASALVYQPDPYAREMLAASLHLAGHTEDALKEWNRLGQPRLDRVEIKGLVHTHDRVARRELALSPEGVLDLGAYRKTRLRLEELGIFSRIELRPLPKQPGHVDLEVDLAERHGFGDRLEIATRSAVNAIRKKIVLRYFDLGGEGINLGLDYKWQRTQPHLKGSVEWPRPFGLPANLRVEALRA